jgi:integrase
MGQMIWKTTKIDNLLREEISGRYYARFWRDGKPKWMSLKTDIYAVAKVRLDKERKAFKSVTETARTVETGAATVEKCAQAYLDKVADKVSIKETTAHYYRQIVKAIIESWPELKTAKPKDISRRDLESWAKRFSSQYSPQRFNNSIDVLRRIFQIAVEQGALYQNPADFLEKVRINRKHIELPSPDEFAAIVKSVRGSGSGWSDPCADLIEFLAFTGCRISEAKHVKWEDVKADEIWIHGGATRTKNSESRPFPMNSQLEALINDLRANPRYRRAKRDEAYLLAVSECQKAIDSAVERLNAKAVDSGEPNIKRFTHHDLRHLFCTRAIESGVDIPTVAKWLGHKDGGALLMKTYSHLLQEHSRAMAAKLSF